MFINSENLTFNEATFMEVWQTGAYRNLHECSTRSKYCEFVRKYVDLYGKPLEKDVVMFRASTSLEENMQNLSGASWSPDLKCVLEFATRFGLENIFSMTIPKGTKAIHIHGTLQYPQNEYVIDTVSVRNETLMHYASCCNASYDKKTKRVSTTWVKADGGKFPYLCSKRSTKEMIAHILSISA